MHLNEAIRQLNPSVFSIVGGGENNRITTPVCYDEDGNEVTVDLTAAQALADSKAYINNRKNEYPSIGDQLDALFHAGLFDSDMAAQIQAVKDKYPKE